MRRLAEQVTELTRSRLVRTLAVGFVALVVADAIFIGILSSETIRTEAQAAHEAQLINTAQKIAALSKALISQRILLDKTLNKPDRGRAENTKITRRILASSNSVLRIWDSTGMPKQEIEEVRGAVRELCAHSNAIYAEGTDKETRRRIYSEYGPIALKLYMLSFNRMHEAHEKALAETAPPSEFDPMALCVVAFVVNLIACVLAGSFIITTITAPISRLSNTCKNLMTGKVIPAPASPNLETRMLEATFHDMSSVVAETENARVAFLKQMQDVQQVTLLHVQQYVEELASAPFAQRPEAADVFRLMKANIEGMLFLLSSMTYGLNFNPDDELVLKPTETSTTELLEHTSKTVIWLMKRKKIELIVEDPAVEFECDVHLIERVILNLLSNASKFSNNRSQIRLSARLLDDGIRFSVRDYGCGISAENQKKLFQKFSQVEAVDGKQRAGSGLGLLICKNIVNAHGGEMICESIENEGTCFWFKLPFKQSQKKHSTAAEPKTGRSIYGGKYTVTLALVFVAYVGIQAFVVYDLGRECKHVQELTAEYEREKKITLGIQDLIASFMTWRQQSIQAAMAADPQSFMDQHSMMTKQQDRIDQLIPICYANSPELGHLQVLKTDLAELTGVTDRILDAITEGNLSPKSKDYKAAMRLGNHMEQNLYALFLEQNEGLTLKYDLGRQLREKILISFIVATSANAVFFIVVCVMGLSIVSKVSELNAKALKFAFGGDLERTIFGKKDDELAFLDERLCDVAQKVRAGQRQRQDLMAIINHDLRTPLGAFLNGLEMLSAGMLGDLSEEDTQLVEQAEAEVKGVLSIIDDFLNEEKAEFEAS